VIHLYVSCKAYLGLCMAVFNRAKLLLAVMLTMILIHWGIAVTTVTAENRYDVNLTANLAITLSNTLVAHLLRSFWFLGTTFVSVFVQSTLCTCAYRFEVHLIRRGKLMLNSKKARSPFSLTCTLKKCRVNYPCLYKVLMVAIMSLFEKATIVAICYNVVNTWPYATNT